MQTVYFSLLHLYILILEFYTVIKSPNLIKFFFYFQLEYLFFSPYYYAGKENDGNFTFGFTPISTINKIMKIVGKKSPINLNVLDMGAGDCRILFFLNIYYKYRCLGIEKNNKFIEKALFINKLLKLQDLELINGDFMDVSWLNYAIIFIAWTTFSQEIIASINEKLIKEQEVGDLVITLSFPVEVKEYAVVYQGKFLFSWGRNMVYVNRRTVK